MCGAYNSVKWSHVGIQIDYLEISCRDTAYYSASYGGCIEVEEEPSLKGGHRATDGCTHCVMSSVLDLGKTLGSVISREMHLALPPAPSDMCTKGTLAASEA